MSIVLSIFFFGLSLGSWITGRVANAIKRPILFYGILEALIGVYSFFLIYVLFDFHHVLGILPLIGTLSWAGNILKFLLVFILLVIPTSLMGASLPLLIQIFVRSEIEIGRKISLLYSINTFGAVFGAWLTGFFLIPHFGIISTNHGAVFLNITVLVLAYFLQQKHTSHTPTMAWPKWPKLKISISLPRQFTDLVLWSAGISGFCAISAEVVWNKYLGIYLGSNIFGLSLILTLFLLGIAIGSFLLSLVIEKVSDLLDLYIKLFAACILSIWIASKLLNVAPVISNVIAYYSQGGISLLAVKSMIAGAFLFIPSSILGALLPLAIRISLKDAKAAPVVTGKIYAINTIGSILGSCITGLILIPTFGSANTIRLVLVLFWIAALILTSNHYRRSLKHAFALLPILAIVLFTPNIRFENIIKSAYFQSASPNLSISEALKYFSQTYEEFPLIVEGRTGIISLSHDPNDGIEYKNYLRLKTNGLNESLYNMNRLHSLPKYEALLGLLPFALGRFPEKAFVVGYGGGYTVDFFTSTRINKVYVAELEKGILDAGQFVYKGNNPIQQRKNLKLMVEDARFILSAKLYGPYDIIVSQPSHSWLTGVANLFTQEFFETVKSNLTDEGIFSQWLNLYNMNKDVLKSILKTFYTVFPNGSVYTNAGDTELIMIGSKRPVSFNYKRVSAILSNPLYQNLLADVPITKPSDLLAQYVMNRDQVLAMAGNAPLNTDRNAYAEIAQSKLFYTEKTTDPVPFLLKQFNADYSQIAKDLPDLPEFYDGLLTSLASDRQKFFKFNSILNRYLLLPIKGSSELNTLARHCIALDRDATAVELLEKSLQTPNEEALALLLQTKLANQEFDSAFATWKKHGKWAEKLGLCAGVEVLTRTKQMEQASLLVNKLEKNQPAFESSCGPYLKKVLGLFYGQKADYLKSLKLYESYLQAMPYDVAARQQMATVYLNAGETGSAREMLDDVEKHNEQERNRLTNAATFFDSQGNTKDASAIRRKVTTLK